MDESIYYDSIEVLALSGKVLRKFESKRDQYELKLPAGAYLVHVKNLDELVFSQKIVIYD
jgi:hypothetical protein